MPIILLGQLNQLPLPWSTMLSESDIKRIVQSLGIEDLVDKRIQDFLASTQPAAPAATLETQKMHYHTTEEIKSLILQHWEEFKKWNGQETFQLRFLIQFLSQRTELREGDKHLFLKGKSIVSRFERQVSNAARDWRDTPFIHAETRGHYRIIR